MLGSIVPTFQPLAPKAPESGASTTGKTPAAPPATAASAPPPVAPAQPAGNAGSDSNKGSTGDRTPSSTTAAFAKAGVWGGYGGQNATRGLSSVAVRDAGLDVGRDRQRLDTTPPAPSVESTKTATAASRQVEQALEAYRKQTAVLKEFEAGLREAPIGRSVGGLDINRMVVDLIV